MRARSSAPDHKAQLLASRARHMRHVPTDSEARLFAALRAGKLGVVFRRQVPVGHRFIVDFLAPAARVVVEVDGGYHEQRRRADARRDDKLRRLGYRVLRLSAELVMADLPAAVAQVRVALGQGPP
jgi:very-short-patch-repair endonuclease